MLKPSIHDKEKKLLFSLSHKDFHLEFFIASGPGGQHRNKVATACRIKHFDSGATAEAKEFKSQTQNKEAAFNRLIETKAFKNWHKLEVARRLLNYQSIEKMIEEGVAAHMADKNIKFEVRDALGKWITVDSDHFNQSSIINTDEYELIGL